MASPRYSRPANHIRAQRSSADATQREPEGADIMSLDLRAGVRRWFGRLRIARPLCEMLTPNCQFPVCVALIAAIAASDAVAQTYPSRPVRFLVGSPPGSGSDLVSRLLAQKLAERLGQPF